MKKICILSAVNIKHMSLISMYTEELKKLGIEFDIIYMDKYGDKEYFPAKKKYRYENVINPKLPKLVRGLHYFKFVGYAKKILRQNKYDFIIVWNDVAIFLFGKYLAKHWKNKYCLNIRDYFQEDVKFIYNIFDKAIKNAAFTTLSSPAFETFLPKSDYIYMHSLNMKVLEQCTKRDSLKSENEKIRITFVGNVRFFEINKRLLDIFRNDSRFELHYYGSNSDVLEEYAKKNNIDNAFFGGRFPVEETNKYIDKVDIINNLYGSGNSGVDYALSIKLYYGIYCNLPILVEKDTYMESFTKDLGIGISVDNLSDDLNDKIYNMYHNIDFKKTQTNLQIELEKIMEQNEIFKRKLKNYVTD